MGTRLYSFELPQSKNKDCGYSLRVPTIYVLSKNMKIIKRFRLKIVIFTAVKKSLYVAWAGFRNVKHSSLCTDLVNM